MKTHDINVAIKELENNPLDYGTLKVPIEAGLLRRGSIRNWIKFAQDHEGLKIHAFENWGLIESTFSIEIEGPSLLIASVLKSLRSAVPV